MNKLKERTLWFVGHGRLIDDPLRGFKGFMYSECGDVILTRKYRSIDNQDLNKKMITGVPYRLAKMGLK